MTTKTKKTVKAVVPETKQEPMVLSKVYGRQNLQVAKHLFNEFVARWDVKSEKKPSIHRLLNDGFRQLGYIRYKRQPGQRHSDAMQMFYEWLKVVDAQVQEDIRNAHKREIETYLAESVCQMFPAREVMFGTQDPELGEVADDTDNFKNDNV